MTENTRVLTDEPAESLRDSFDVDMIDAFVAAASVPQAVPQPVSDRRVGLKALVDSAVVSHEKLPMLDVVFDRFVRTLSTSMRNFTSDNIEITIQRVTAMRLSDFLADITPPSLISVVHSPQWDNYSLFTVDAKLAYTVLDALLGGRRYGAQLEATTRAFTTIETQLIEKMLNIVSEDLSAAFAPLTDVSFTIDRMETNPTFASIVQPSNICAVATVSMKMGQHGGALQVLLPYATIEPIREMLIQRFMGEKFGRDGIWEAHLANEIRKTNITVSAVIGEKQMRLGDVMDFSIGQTLPLSVGKDEPIDLRAGAVKLASCTIGRIGENMAVKVTETASRKEEAQ